MLKTAHLLAALLLVSSVTISNPASAESLRDVMTNIIPGEIFTTGNANTLRPVVAGGSIIDRSALGEDTTGEDGGMSAGIFTPGPELGMIWDRMSRDIQNLPSPAGVAALTYARDPETGELVRTSQGLGAIFADRAQTLGKGKFNFGIDWSHIINDNWEGSSLRQVYLQTRPDQAIVFTGRNSNADRINRSVVLVHSGPNSPAFPVDGVSFNLIDDDQTGTGGTTGCGFSANGTPEGMCAGTLADDFVYRAGGPEGEYNTKLDVFHGLDVNIHLNLDIVNFYFGYGLTDTVDVAAIVPIIKADLVIDVDYRPGTQQVGPFSGQLNCDPTDAQCWFDNYRDFMISEFENTNSWKGDHPVQPPKTAPDGGLMYNYGINARNFYIPERFGADAFNGIIPKKMLHGNGNDSGFGDIKLRGKWNFLQSPAIDLAGRFDVRIPTGNEDNFRGTGEWILNPTLIASKTFGWFSPHVNIGLDFTPGKSQYSLFHLIFGADARLHERATVSVSFVASSFLKSMDGKDNERQAIAAGMKVRLWKNMVARASAMIQLNHDGLTADVYPTLGLEYVFF